MHFLNEYMTQVKSAFFNVLFVVFTILSSSLESRFLHPLIVCMVINLTHNELESHGQMYGGSQLLCLKCYLKHILL